MKLRIHFNLQAPLERTNFEASCQPITSIPTAWLWGRLSSLKPIYRLPAALLRDRRPNSKPFAHFLTARLWDSLPSLNWSIYYQQYCWGAIGRASNQSDLSQQQGLKAACQILKPINDSCCTAGEPPVKFYTNNLFLQHDSEVSYQALNESVQYHGCRSDCQVLHEWHLFSQHRYRYLTKSQHRCSAANQMLNKSNLFPQDGSRTACHILNKLNSIPVGRLQSLMPGFRQIKLTLAAQLGGHLLRKSHIFPQHERKAAAKPNVFP